MSGTRRACLPFTFLAICSAVFAGSNGPFGNTFLANEGQWPQDILYKGRSATANVALLRNAISFSLVEPEDEEHEDEHVDHHAEPEFIVWNMNFLDINPAMRVYGEGGERSVTNYLSGNDPSKWVVRPMQYDRILYKDLHTGIDLQFHIAGYDLEYDYVVHPGADLSRIRNAYAGIEKLQVNAGGDLVITTSMGTQVQRAPVAWQVIEGEKRPVQVDFVLHNDSTFGFVARNGYDRAHALIVDPLFEMVWASYTRAIGFSNNNNYCFGSAMDAQGNVYLTGIVDSTFPTTPGAYSGPGNVFPDVFVAKFSSDGTTLLYSTYLPGQSSEFGTSIAVDALGRAYVTGVVDLNITGITNFPSTPNAFQPVHNEGADAYLTVLDPTGSSLVYSTFLGGTGSETAFAVALGPTGIAYITGTTSFGNYPEVAATNYPDGQLDVFVAKFDIAQAGAASLLYSVRIGGGSSAQCATHGIAVDDDGNAYVTGSTGFGNGTFPVTPGAYNTTYATGVDGTCAFLFKLGNTLPVSLVYSTFLGPGMGTSVAVNASSGEAFVSGTTYTTQFPTTAGALQPAHGGATDAFALRMNAAGSDLIYSTFLGGPGYDQSTDLVVNSADEVYLVGLTYTNFPVSPGAFQEANLFSPATDLFVAHLNAGGTAYACGGATYVGGADMEYYGSFYNYLAPDVDLREGVQDTLSIAATSHSLDFPTTPGVYEPNKVNSIADQPVFFKMTCALIAAPPVAAFNASVTPTCTGSGTVDFFDNSTNGATSWTWSFPGGTPANSTEQDPQDISYPAPGSYTVTLEACNDLGCDTITEEITITTAPSPVVALGNDTTVCAGDALTLIATPGFASYAWQQDGIALPGITATITVDTAGTYTVLVNDTLGCAGADTVQVGILPRPVAAFTHTAPPGPCGTGIVSFAATTPADSYTWDFGDGTQGSGSVQEHLYAASDTYDVQLTVTIGPCSATITVPVEVTVTTAPASQPLLGNDTTACAGNTITLNAASGYIAYAWQLDGTPLPGNSGSIVASVGGSYTVLVSDTLGCAFADTVQVALVQRPVPAFTYTAAAGPCAFGAVRFIAASGGGSYAWDFGDGAQAFGAVQDHGFDTPGTYTVQLTMTTGPCSASISMFVDVATTSTGAPPGPPSIPNVFSPNGDGVNDCFAPVGMEAFADCYRLVIYNRWGQEVYRSRTPNTCWRGTTQSGEPLPDGVYYYLLTIGEVEHNGYVELLR